MQPLLALATPFMLILTRVGGMLAAAPVFGHEAMPVRLRAALALTLSVVLTSALPSTSSELPAPSAFAGELLLGAAFGLLLRFAFAAVELAGELIAGQAGFAFAEQMGGGSLSGTPVSRLIGLAAALLFFATGAHHQALRGLHASLQTIPPGTARLDAALFANIAARADELFAAGLRLALPLAAVLLATQLAFGLMSRVAPQLNVWSHGLLVTMTMTLVLLVVSAPSLFAEIETLIADSVADATTLIGGGT
jgi:flagellar biosynthesis protein FliR